MKEKCKLWIGREKEGENRGLMTLFIGDKFITYELIRKIVKIHGGIEQLYFGAGRCTEINWIVLKRCVVCNREIKDLIITVEIGFNNLLQIDKEIINNINVVITIEDDRFLYLNSNYLNRYIIKLQDSKCKFLMTKNLGEFIQTDTSKLIHKTYNGDVVIK